jgi:hypothetical protein
MNISTTQTQHKTGLNHRGRRPNKTAHRVGVWFGFALRCVALLCGAFVRLHLTLFPAGGPFLPSLYVNIYSDIFQIIAHTCDNLETLFLGKVTKDDQHDGLERTCRSAATSSSA